MLLVVQDYIRHSHVVQNPSTNPYVDYKQCEQGKLLTKELKNAGYKRTEYEVTYAYPKIPAPKKIDEKTGKIFSYKDVSQSELAPYTQRLVDKLVESKPDLVIPTGNLGCKILLGQAKIKSLRGKPVQKEFVHSTGERYTVWVFPMLSMEYYQASLNTINLVKSDFSLLARYKEQGEALFTPDTIDYTFLDDFDEVMRQFDYIETHCPVTAWDLETNTLRSELEGAKILVFTFSYKEYTGFTLPLEHKEWKEQGGWTPEQEEKIYQRIQQFLANGRIPKVGHNTKFDIGFCNSLKGFTEFRSCRDTIIFYYEIVTQEVEESFKLTDLAYELTDMGGYDAPLERFKKEYTKKELEKRYKEIQDKKDQVSKEIKEQHEQEMEKYKLHVKEHKAYLRLCKTDPTEANAKFDKEYHKEPVKPVKPPLPKFPAKSSIKLVNEVDGSNFNYEWIPLKVLHPYASGDVDCCLRIHNRLLKRIEPNKDMLRLVTQDYPRLTATLALMSTTGVHVDAQYLDTLEIAYTEEVERLTEELRSFDAVKAVEEEKKELYLLGVQEFEKPVKERDKELVKYRNKYKDGETKFVLKSATDKGKLLFDVLGCSLPYDKECIKEKTWLNNIPESELTWTDYRTNKHVLSYLLEHSEDTQVTEICTLLLRISKVATLKSGFTTKLKKIMQKDSRIHGKYSETGTETSRLAANNPNLQQIPAKTGDITRFDYKYPIKRIFTTEFENGAMVQGDYQALELRIGGLASGDPSMLEALLQGKDLHMDTACNTWNLRPEQVTPDIRKSAKAVSFGLFYGETPFSFAPKNGMTVEEAEDVFNRYFQAKPKIKDFIEKTHEKAEKDGYIDTLQGHRRMLRNIYSKERKKYNEALRQAVNTKIQGTGAYLTNFALVLIDAYIRQNNLRSKLVLTVHDSIVVDCPPEEIELMAHSMKYIMENLPIDFLFIERKGEKIRFPIVADLEVGVNYNDMVDYEVTDDDGNVVLKISDFKTINGYTKYLNDLKKIKDYKNSGKLSDELYEKTKAQIEASLDAYKKL